MPENLIPNTALILALLVLLSLTKFLHRFLSYSTKLKRHTHAQNLTELVISAVITQLHNGEDLRPYTLEHILSVIQHYLADVLLHNGYQLRDWNPKYLIYAELTKSGLLHDLLSIVKERAEGESCQASPTGTPTTPTPE